MILWGALDFFREILKKDPVDVSVLFELWAVSRERGDTGADTLLAVQQECTNIITSGLRAVLARTKVKMNFENYIKSLVEGKNIGLVGWPKGVKFKRMSKQSKIGPLRILHDALKCGTVKWKVLTLGEKKQLMEQYKDMVRKGEATEKAGKAKAPRKRSTRTKLKKTVAEEQSGDEWGPPGHILQHVDATPPKPERVKLFMLSKMEPQDGTRLQGCVLGLVAMEAKLHVAQCDNSLVSLRSCLHAKRHFIGFHNMNITGQVHVTKACMLIEQLGEQAEVYAN
ncbi:hypothetical protein DFH09DRAFT_1301608 [Mycena vulgaris]|nr:hypothetical protein DFH09DRAFT_1301608 [Mycena vulgaris]